MRRIVNRLGTTLVVLGVVLCVYAAGIVFWRDPVTDVYTTWQQRGLRGGLDRADADYGRRARVAVAEATATTPGTTKAAAPAPDSARIRAAMRRLATEFGRDLAHQDGAPVARLHIPRMGLGTIVVQGTSYWDSLSKGPGHYDRTVFPGLGRTVAIAGHRTTFSAPFRHIDDLRAGDVIDVRMPYGDFRYRVTTHRIVDNGDWSIVRDVGYDQLVLSACHPLYSADQRWVVFARLASVTPPGGGRSIPV